MQNMDAVRHPAKRVGRGYAPEESVIERTIEYAIERVVVRIRVVVDGVGPRVVVIDRPRLVNDYAFGLVVGHATVWCESLCKFPAA
jgi:hypothetical protein